jgi:hypothetical protein
VKANMNSIELHQELCNETHLVDGALVGASSLQPFVQALCPMQEHQLEKKTFTNFKPITHQVKLKIFAINILFKVSSSCTCLLK